MEDVLHKARKARSEMLAGQTIATWLQRHTSEVETATWLVNDTKRRLNRAYDMDHTVEHVRALEERYADACDRQKQATDELVNVTHKVISDHYGLLATTSLQKR